MSDVMRARAMPHRMTRAANRSVCAILLSLPRAESDAPLIPFDLLRCQPDRVSADADAVAVAFYYFPSPSPAVTSHSSVRGVNMVSSGIWAASLLPHSGSGKENKHHISPFSHSTPVLISVWSEGCCHRTEERN